jgi:hypothetical protein
LDKFPKIVVRVVTKLSMLSKASSAQSWSSGATDVRYTLVNNLALISKYSVEQVELIKGFGVWVCQGACYKNWCFGSGQFCLSFFSPVFSFRVSEIVLQRLEVAVQRKLHYQNDL